MKTGTFEKCLVIVAAFTTTWLCLLAFGPRREPQQPPIAFQQPQWPQPAPTPPPRPQQPAAPNISKAIPGYQDYSGTVSQIQQWEKEAPDLVETGTYGSSAKGQKLYFIRLSNEFSPSQKVVLITASIHGNEPWSTSTVMAYIGTMLSKYGKDDEITKLVNERTIYFVPVISPDSYPNSRHVDGVDPNRDFPGPRNPNRQSTPAVAAIQSLFRQIKPCAVISGHTFGRIYLHPFGDSMQTCPNHADFQRIVGEMGRLSNYRVDRACNMYNSPIHGTEVDWYYRNGAFAIVMEFGTHQRIPSMEDTTSEFNRTFKAVLYFMREAPEVKVQNYRILRAAA